MPVGIKNPDASISCISKCNITWDLENRTLWNKIRGNYSEAEYHFSFFFLNSEIFAGNIHTDVRKQGSLKGYRHSLGISRWHYKALSGLSLGKENWCVSKRGASSSGGKHFGFLTHSPLPPRRHHHPKTCTHGSSTGWAGPEQRLQCIDGSHLISLSS